MLGMVYLFMVKIGYIWQDVFPRVVIPVESLNSRSYSDLNNDMDQSMDLIKKRKKKNIYLKNNFKQY